eukprot:gene6127-12405_t
MSQLRRAPFLSASIRFLSTRPAEIVSPVFSQIIPGSRVLQLSEPESSNILKGTSLGMLNNFMTHFDDNITISAVFFASSSPDVFSGGVDENEIREKNGITIKLVHDVINSISSSKKVTLAVYGGYSSGSGYAIFSGSKYLLGTPSTKICIDELSRGYLPLGGLAYRFARGCPEGVAAARYFGCSQAMIYGNDAFSLGLVTHLVEEEPHISLCNALAHTISPRALEKSTQTESVDIDALPDLIEALHGEWDIDVLDDEMWNKVLLVPMDGESEVFNDPSFSAEDAYTLAADIQHCFSTDDIQETVVRLREIASKESGAPWATRALSNMEQLHPLLLHAWYKLTGIAGKGGLEAVLEAEERVNSVTNNVALRRLLEKTLEGPSDETVDLLSRLRSVSQTEVDALFKPLTKVVSKKSPSGSKNTITSLYCIRIARSKQHKRVDYPVLCWKTLSPCVIVSIT